MQDFASLGLELRTGVESTPREQRISVYLKETGSFVAWFQNNRRNIDGEVVNGTNTQIIRREDLTKQQLAAIKEYLRELVIATI